MTRKDYILIAAAIKQSADLWEAQSGPWYGVEHTAVNIGIALQADNPRFDPHVFIRACGLPESTAERIELSS